MFFFHKYCYSTAFYCSQILPLFNNYMDDIYTAWRVARHKVCMVPWTIHCNLLLHLAGVMDPELWFSKRIIRCIKIAFNSYNVIVRTIINVVFKKYVVLNFHVYCK